MSTFGTDIAERFGPEATAEAAYELLTVDVPASSWPDALRIARDELGCTYFDWLSAVDEPGTGFRVCAHVVSLEKGEKGENGEAGTSVRRLMLRTTVPHDAPALPTAVEVFPGAGWHERETHEMFGVDFTGHPHLAPLLLPETFEGHPLRKDFVLAARVAKAWPGAKEPGESEHGGPKRRQMLPPGVPDPNEWGPLKGRLPAAPTRPARTPRAAGERPPRRTRSASEGSASQAGSGGPAASGGPADTAGPAASGDPAAAAEGPRAAGGGPVARRSRSAAEGSESQAPVRRSRSASEGSADPRGAAEEAAAPPGSAHGAADRPAGRPGEAEPPSAPAPGTRGADAPWHHARPAFDASERPRPESAAQAGRGEREAPLSPGGAAAGTRPEAGAGSGSGGGSGTVGTEQGKDATGSPHVPGPERESAPEPSPEPGPEREPEQGPEREPAPEPSPEPSPERDPGAGPDGAPAASPPSRPGPDGTPPSSRTPSSRTPRPGGGSDEGPGPRPDDATGGDRA